MKPTPILIQALRKTAQDVLDPEQYCWTSYLRCNCGLLARNLLGISDAEVFREFLGSKNFHNDIDPSYIGVWSSFDKGFCGVTGLPTTEISKILSKYGLEKDDFRLLEFAGLYPKNERDNHFSRPEFVSKFMLDLADKLEAQLKSIVDMAEKPVSV